MARWIHAPEDFLAALDGKDAQPGCPSCGANDRWGGFDRRFYLPLAEPGRADFKKGLEVVAAVCGQCGFVRPHATEVLED
jgi:hypothetical protein